MQLTAFNVILFLAASFLSDTSALKSVNNPTRVPVSDSTRLDRFRREVTSPFGVATQSHRLWKPPTFRTSKGLEEKLLRNLRKRMKNEPSRNIQRPHQRQSSIDSKMFQFTPSTSSRSSSPRSGRSGMSSIPEAEEFTVMATGPSSQKVEDTPRLTWEKAVQKGKELMKELDTALMENEDRKPAKTINELKQDEWEFDTSGTRPKVVQNLQPVFAKFLYKPDSKNLRTFSVTRSKGQNPTVYECAVDRSGYFLVALNNRKDKGETTHWSEVAFSVLRYYRALKNDDPSKLKYVVRHNVKNADTKAIIDEAYKNSHETLNETPFAWTKEIDAFYALLGTVNGKGVVRMLTDYSKSLGHKTIGSIFTAQSKQDNAYHIIFDLIRKSSEVNYHPGSSVAAEAGTSSSSQSASTASSENRKSNMQSTTKALSRARIGHAPLRRRSPGRTLQWR